MKHSFSSVVVLAFLLHLPALVLGAPFAWGNRHAYFARSIAANETTTAVAEGETASTTLEKAAEATETAFANSTTIAEETATPTKTEAESTASATIIHGKSPLQTALLPSITDWNSCQSFLSSSGINLFVNQVNLNFDVVINEVTVIQILIDDRGRARQTRVRHAFPQPTDYYPEFDQRKNKGGNRPGIGKGKATATHLTATITATPVAKESKEATATDTETASQAEETATATETASEAEETATETASEAEETATATESASQTEETATATASEAQSEETSSA